MKANNGAHRSGVSVKDHTSLHPSFLPTLSRTSETHKARKRRRSCQNLSPPPRVLHLPVGVVAGSDARLTPRHPLPPSCLVTARPGEGPCVWPGAAPSTRGRQGLALFGECDAWTPSNSPRVQILMCQQSRVARDAPDSYVKFAWPGEGGREDLSYSSAVALTISFLPDLSCTLSTCQNYTGATCHVWRSFQSAPTSPTQT